MVLYQQARNPEKIQNVLVINIKTTHDVLTHAVPLSRVDEKERKSLIEFIAQNFSLDLNAFALLVSIPDGEHE